MKEHLDFERIVEWESGFCNEVYREHLAECLACRQAAENVHRKLTSVRDEIESAMPSNGEFWDRQKTAILERVAAKRSGGGLRWALAAAAVFFLTAASFLLKPKPPAHSSDQDDEALLRLIQDDLDRHVPRALAPAALLTKERNDQIERANYRQSENKVRK